MAECPASVCAICYGTLRDARLLGCLHSFCKTCLDDLHMRTGHAHEISCPVCRRKCRLPESGVSGLAKDITVKEELMCDCHTCKDEGGDTKGELWCTACEVAFCKDHGVAHLLAQSDQMHPVTSFAKAKSREKVSVTSASLRHCRQHNLPLVYFCKQCDAAICGGCTALGDHHGHKPIVGLRGIAKDLKERASRKTNKLKIHLPRVQRALSVVDEVSSELSSRAEFVRTNIRSSKRSVIEAVELLFEQKLAEVDDLEKIRLKHLASQHDDLQFQADSLKSVIRFSETLLEEDAETEDLCDLLLTVNNRADELEKVEVAEQPVELSWFDYEKVNETELLVKASELAGGVLPGHASAKHSFVEGETRKTCSKGSAVSFVIVAKDYNNRFLINAGQDVIRAELCESPEVEDFPSPRVLVIDKKDGTFEILFMPECEGEYSFDVFVTNVKLRQRLSISCYAACIMFDPTKCEANSTISEDKLTVTHSGGGFVWSSVLGSVGMKTGEHIWKVKVTRSKSMNIFLGVAEKCGFTQQDNQFKWQGCTGDKCEAGRRKSEGTNRWQEKDILQFHLNCNDHTLTLTNIRSGETDTIANLPTTELFAYFCTYRKGNSLTLVQ